MIGVGHKNTNLPSTLRNVKSIDFPVHARPYFPIRRTSTYRMLIILNYGTCWATPGYDGLLGRSYLPGSISNILALAPVPMDMDEGLHPHKNNGMQSLIHVNALRFIWVKSCWNQVTNSSTHNKHNQHMLAQEAPRVKQRSYISNRYYNGSRVVINT